MKMVVFTTLKDGGEDEVVDEDESDEYSDDEDDEYGYDENSYE